MGIGTLYFYKIDEKGNQIKTDMHIYKGWRFIDDIAQVDVYQKCFHTALSVFNLAKKELK